MTRVWDAVHIQQDRALIGEFAGVTQQVQQDLANFCDVSPHHADVLRHTKLEFICVLRYRWFEGHNDFLNHVCDAEGFDVELHLAGFNFGQVEDVID